MAIRAYNKETDLEPLQKTWEEIGWATSQTQKDAMALLFDHGDVAVGTFADVAEAVATVHDGVIRYVDTDLSLAAVTAVTASMVARKQGFATDLTAHVLSNAMDRGQAVAALGMFEQGFYDRLGFGTASYDFRMMFDPAKLDIATPYRPPTRFGVEQAEAVFELVESRKRSHGGVNIGSAEFRRFEMLLTDGGFGWGYFEGDQLTHGLWATKKDYSGPIIVEFMAYRTTDQLMELLAILRESADQIRSVKLSEPAEIQLQDIVAHPIRQRIQTQKSPHEAGMNAFAWWQLRILDLAPVVEARSWIGEPFEFNLVLEDPLNDHIGKGLTGTYRVAVGSSSTIVPTSPDTALPTLTASINAFSRMWFGVRSASALAITDTLKGPPALLANLDAAFALPRLVPGLYF